MLVEGSKGAYGDMRRDVLEVLGRDRNDVDSYGQRESFLPVVVGTHEGCSSALTEAPACTLDMYAGAMVLTGGRGNTPDVGELG